MDISIFVANENIQYVKGTEKNGIVKIEEAERFPMPEGAVMNGLITDQNLLIQGIEKLTEKYPLEDEKNVRIVVNSSHVFTKTMLVPRLSEKKMLKWIEGEFLDNVNEDEEMLYDYSILNSDEEGDYAILCAVQKSLIGTYIDVFENTFGANIKCIDASINCQIKLMDEVDLDDDTFVVLTFDGNSMSANLYVNGLFRVSRRVRLLSERETPEMSGEVAQTISNLIQFNETEKNGEKINKIYLFGTRKNEDFLRKDIRETFGIDPKTLKNETAVVETDISDFVLDEYAYAVGNLIRK